MLNEQNKLLVNPVFFVCLLLEIKAKISISNHLFPRGQAHRGCRIWGLCNKYVVKWNATDAHLKPVNTVTLQ